ncbi:uncharacterized protein LOC134270853 [Saccostrea cucullata]|uniref:uncharacterized protein LOC134270853 n=1 Tax=Saccostrea cuccullata TaxID=36930 RepID=UPI002ED0AE5F
MSIMSMARTSMYVYFWILMTTLKHWVVKCDKLEGYSFPVYNTTSCPRNQSEWRNRSSDLNCTESNGYMCIPNENITQLVEFCYRYPRIPIEKSICLILKKTTSLVEAYSCKQFRNGCPDKLYWSNEVFKYQSCLSIGNGCFLAEPPCNEQGITTIGPTETKSTAVTGDIDENNTWVWVLVMGVFMLFFLIAACVPVIIIRRGKQKTFVVAKLHKRKDDIQTSSHSLKERELNAMERIPFIEFEGERRECEETQGEKDREQKKLGEEKSDDNALSDCIMDEQDDTLGLSIDETSKMADSSLEDISKEEYSSLNKDVSSGINSYLKQQGDGDRISSEKHEIGLPMRYVMEHYHEEGGHT